MAKRSATDAAILERVVQISAGLLTASSISEELARLVSDAGGTDDPTKIAGDIVDMLTPRGRCLVELTWAMHAVVEGTLTLPRGDRDVILRFLVWTVLTMAVGIVVLGSVLGDGTDLIVGGCVIGLIGFAVITDEP